LRFWLTDIPKGMENNQVLHFNFSNFHTPWSGQVLKTIEVRYYADEGCSKNQRQRALPALLIQPGSIPLTNLGIRSYSKKHGEEPQNQILGYKGNDNVLELKFTPKTTTALQGKGMIEVKVPYWYVVGTAKDWMYSDGATNQCKSTNMTIYAS
jgi:hypothetical protein